MNKIIFTPPGQHYFSHASEPEELLPNRRQMILTSERQEAVHLDKSAMDMVSPPKVPPIEVNATKL